LFLGVPELLDLGPQVLAEIPHFFGVVAKKLLGPLCGFFEFLRRQLASDIELALLYVNSNLFHRPNHSISHSEQIDLFHGRLVCRHPRYSPQMPRNRVSMAVRVGRVGDLDFFVLSIFAILRLHLFTIARASSQCHSMSARLPTAFADRAKAKPL
jgi:hypothetical protein